MAVVRSWYLITFGSVYCELIIVFFFSPFFSFKLAYFFMASPFLCFHFACHSPGFVTSCHRMLQCSSAPERTKTAWALSKFHIFCMYRDNKLPSWVCAQLTCSCASIPVDQHSICLTARVFCHTRAAAPVYSSHGWGYNALACSSLLASLIFKWTFFFHPCVKVCPDRD